MDVVHSIGFSRGSILHVTHTQLYNPDDSVTENQLRELMQTGAEYKKADKRMYRMNRNRYVFFVAYTQEL